MADQVTDWLTVRVRLQDAAAFNSQMKAAGGAVETFGNEARVAGDKTAFAAEKTFLLGEEMYSLRRYAFYAQTALGLTAAGALKLGYDFLEAKSKGVDSLTSLVGGVRQARAEVQKLVDVSESAGLGLPDLVTGARNMLTFGFSVKQTNAYLEAFSNFAGRRGLGAAGVQSLISLFNRVKDQGFFTGRQVRQLDALGIPGNQVLTQGLGLNADMTTLLRQGQLRISAQEALPAIAGWINRYANRQRMPLSEQWGRAKAFLGNAMGTLETPLFNWFEGFVPRLNGAFQRAARGAQTGGMTGLLFGLDRSGTAAHVWITLRSAVQAVVPVLRAAWDAAKPFFALLAVGASVVSVLAQHTGLLKGAAWALAAVYVYSRARALLLIGTEKLLGVTIVDLTGITETATAAQKMNAVWTDRTTIAQLGLYSATTKLKGAWAALAGMGPIALVATLSIIPAPPKEHGFAQTNSTAQWFARLPVVGHAFGWLNYFNDRYLDRWLGTSPGVQRGQIARVTPVTSNFGLAPALAAAIGNIEPAGVYLDTAKVGEAVFRYKNNVQGRS